MSTLKSRPTLAVLFSTASQRCALVMLGALTVAALGCHGRRSSPVDTATSSPARPRGEARAQPQQLEPAPAFGLELRLLALQTTYSLEGDGQPLRDRIEDARYAEAGDRAAIAREPDLRSRLQKSIELLANYAPDPLPVRLAVEVANRTATPIEILPQGNDTFKLGLVLKGPEVAVMKVGRLVTLEARDADPVSIAPGQSYRLPIRALAYGLRGDEERAYWTRPGKYSITATLRTRQRPAPPGVQANEDGFALVTLTSNDAHVVVRGTKSRR